MHRAAFGFYLLGERAFQVLSAVIRHCGREAVAWVVCGSDAGVVNDRSSDIQSCCLDAGIRLFPAKGSEPEIPVVARFAIGWRRLLPESANLIVLHDSLLPRYRGFAPLVNALINGEPDVGVTAIRAAADYDCGEILAQRTLQLTYPMRIADALSLTGALYQEMVIDLAQRLAAGEALRGVPQSETDATYSLWRDDRDYRIDWRRSSAEIKRFVDAVGYPYKGAEAACAGTAVRILQAELVDDVVIEDRASHLGKTIFRRGVDPVVVCGSGLLRLCRVVDAMHGQAIDLPFRTRFN